MHVPQWFWGGDISDAGSRQRRDHPTRDAFARYLAFCAAVREVNADRDLCERSIDTAIEVAWLGAESADIGGEG